MEHHRTDEAPVDELLNFIDDCGEDEVILEEEAEDLLSLLRVNTLWRTHNHLDVPVLEIFNAEGTFSIVTPLLVAVRAPAFLPLRNLLGLPSDGEVSHAGVLGHGAGLQLEQGVEGEDVEEHPGGDAPLLPQQVRGEDGDHSLAHTSGPGGKES